MHPADIKAALEKRGSSVSAIARALDRNFRTVSSVVRGVATSRLIANAVAEVVGLPIEQLWPGKYDAPRGRRKKDATK